MLGRAKKQAALMIMTLLVTVILLPLVSIAATSPIVTVLSPLTQGVSAPVRIALDAAGNIFVADQGVGGVVKFNAYGVKQMTISTVDAPNGLAFAQDGSLLVSQASSVVRYDAVTGQEIGRLTGGQFQVPVGIAVDDVTGYIYVADSRANQVEMYSASGQYVKAFAQGITADETGATVYNPLGKLSRPMGISFEKVSRQLAVADTMSRRVQFFDVEGNFVKSIGLEIAGGTTSYATTLGPMQFSAPVAIAFEYSKNQVPVVLARIYVVDRARNNVEVVDPDTGLALNVSGATNNYIGSSGVVNGKLLSPLDAVFDAANNRLLVVNGSGNITIYGIDGGSNPVNTAPPALAIDPVPATVTVSSVTISGTVDAGASVSVSAGSAALAGPVVYTSATAWKCDVTGLVVGNNTISVTASDAAGNATPVQSVNVTYLVPAPALSISSAVPGLTNVATLVVTGTVDAGATVTVTNTNTAINGAATVVDTSWSYTVALAEGINSISVSAQKPLSSVAKTSVNVTLDTAAPLLVVSALSDGSYASSQIQNITGNVSDTSAVTVLINDIQATLVNGTFSVPVTLVNGSNVIAVTASDAAGNVSRDSRVIYYDVTSPVINIVSPMDNSFTNNINLQISGSIDETPKTITVAGVPAVVDNDTNTWTANIDLVAGLNTIEIVATDLAGNTSSMKRSVVLDTFKPVLAISYPVQDIALNRPSVDIVGTVNDNSTITLTYSLNDTITPVPVDAGNFAFNVTFTKEGVYPVIITATDLAGNSTTAIRSVIYDITPPVLTLDTVKWQAQSLGGKLSGTVEPGSTVTVNEGSTAIGRVSVDGNKWSADLSGISYSQSKLSVAAVDAAGNSTSIMIKAK
ncbi:MAG: hypothetical protein WA003_07895 [Desulfuromonadaceae bacterium]